MRLYVLRHGLALSVTEAQVAHDADRPLADLGREDIRAMAAYLLERGAKVERILCSPLKRARQTAEEAAAILAPKVKVAVYEPLANQISGEELYQSVQALSPKARELLLVGHQPQLGEFVSHLVGSAVELRPGGLAAIEIEGAKPKLLWSRNP